MFFSNLDKNQKARCYLYAQHWEQLVFFKDGINKIETIGYLPPRATKVSDCVADVLTYLSSTNMKAAYIDVLVTGSLHLVGATLSAINNNK